MLHSFVSAVTGRRHSKTPERQQMPGDVPCHHRELHCTQRGCGVGASSPILAWHIPQLRQLLEKKTKGCEIVCSMCAFRARYLKATKVKVWNADSLPDSPARIKCKRCKVPGKRGTICGFTGDAHLSLTGVVKYGNKTAFSTQCAEQYPKAFAEWALRLLTGVMRRRGVRLDLD